MPTLTPNANLVDQLNQLLTEDVSHLESPMARAMEVVGDKYALVILDRLMETGCKRFVELETEVVGISPRTLSARLKQLERHGLIRREQFPTIPPRVEYTLTESGRDLAVVVETLRTWGDRWFPYRAG